MAQLDELVGKENIRQVLDLDKALIDLDETYKKVFLSSQQAASGINEQITNYSKLQAVQTQTATQSKALNEAEKEAARIAKEQAATLAALDKQRQAAYRAQVRDANKAYEASQKQAKKEKELTNALTKEAKTVEELRKQNIALIAARNKVDSSSAKGQAEIKQLNSQINANTQAIKANVSAHEKQAMNIGNYKSALGGIKNLIGGLGLAMGIGGFISLTKEAVNAAAAAEGVSKAFSKLKGSEALLESLKEATRGTVGEFDLMRGAVQWDNFKMPLEKLPIALEFASRRAADTGESMEFLVESIVKGLGRKSPLILDNLGLSVTKINSEVAKTGDFFEGVFNVIEQDLAKSGEKIDGMKESIGRMNVSLEDTKIAWGEVVGSFGEAGGFSFITGVIDNFKDKIDAIGEAKGFKKLWELIKFIGGGIVLGPILQQIGEEISNWFEDLLADTKFGKFLTNTFGLWKEEAKESTATADEVVDGLSEIDKEAQKVIKSYEEISEEIDMYENKLRASIAANDGQAQSIADEINKLKAQKDAIDKTVDSLTKSTEKTKEKTEVDKEAARERERQLKEELELQHKVFLAKNKSDEELYKEYLDRQKAREQAMADMKRLTDEYRDEEESEDFDRHMAELARIEEENQKTIESEEAKKEAKMQAAQMYLNAAADYGGQLFEINQMLIDNEVRKMEEAKAYELQMAGDNVAKREAIEKKYDKEATKLKQKQAKQDKAQALFNAIVKTAQAVLAGLAFGPPLGYVFAALNAVLGAVQIGIIASQPIPQFAKGTENAPDGVISVAEKGKELIKTRSGKVLLAKKPTLLAGMKGAKIFTNEQTEALLAMQNVGYDSKELRQTLDRNNRDLIRAIRDKREVHITPPRGSRITEREGSYFKTYLDKKINR